jgi:hypothetical protein
MLQAATAESDLVQRCEQVMCNQQVAVPAFLRVKKCCSSQPWLNPAPFSNKTPVLLAGACIPLCSCPKAPLPHLKAVVKAVLPLKLH